jgi:hypothetical protein
LRLQPRHTPHQISAIWLSTSRKELPPPETPPAAGPGEIVIRAGAPVTLQGNIKKIAGADGAEAAVEFGANPAAKPVEGNPPHTDRGRKTRGSSEFTMQIDPKNIGVLLRRKLDYQFPNQRAEVSIAEAGGDQWQPAGVWYLAGSNTCVYSNPREELGATQHVAQTSNRRFREDEFLVPRALTEGRSAIRVRVKFTPVETPLFPGHPLPELAWSEIRYLAYSFLAP